MNDTVIDPKTGEPIVPGGDPPQDPPADEYVPKAEFDALKQRLDAFDKGYQYGGGGRQEPEPPAPSGPSVSDQIADIDKEINALGAEIDKAIADEQPVSALLTKRDNLTSKRIELKIQSEQIDPLREFGTAAIDQLSSHVASGNQDLAVKYDFVKRDMDSLLNAVPASQRTLEVRKKAYEMAIGQNYAAIQEAQREEWRRENPAPIPEPGDGSRGGAGNGNPDIPRPEDVWDADNLRALKETGKDPLSYVKSLGYNTWEAYYEDNKEYFDL